MPNLNAVKEEKFDCFACNYSKAVKRPSKKPILDLPAVLESLKGNTFKIKPMPYNKRLIRLAIINRKLRYK